MFSSRLQPHFLESHKENWKMHATANMYRSMFSESHKENWKGCLKGSFRSTPAPGISQRELKAFTNLHGPRLLWNSENLTKRIESLTLTFWWSVCLWESHKENWKSGEACAEHPSRCCRNLTKRIESFLCFPHLLDWSARISQRELKDNWDVCRKSNFTNYESHKENWKLFWAPRTCILEPALNLTKRIESNVDGHLRRKLTPGISQRELKVELTFASDIETFTENLTKRIESFSRPPVALQLHQNLTKRIERILAIFNSPL